MFQAPKTASIPADAVECGAVTSTTCRAGVPEQVAPAFDTSVLEPLAINLDHPGGCRDRVSELRHLCVPDSIRGSRPIGSLWCPRQMRRLSGLIPTLWVPRWTRHRRSNLVRSRVHRGCAVRFAGLNRREIIVGLPETIRDGLARDADGGLWISCHRRNRILRLDPNGELEAILNDRPGAELLLPSKFCFACLSYDLLVVSSLAKRAL